MDHLSPIKRNGSSRERIEYGEPSSRLERWKINRKS